MSKTRHPHDISPRILTVSEEMIHDIVDGIHTQSGDIKHKRKFIYSGDDWERLFIPNKDIILTYSIVHDADENYVIVVEDSETQVHVTVRSISTYHPRDGSTESMTDVLKQIIAEHGIENIAPVHTTEQEFINGYFEANEFSDFDHVAEIGLLVIDFDNIRVK